MMLPGVPMLSKKKYTNRNRAVKNMMNRNMMKIVNIQVLPILRKAVRAAGAL